jgi:hypothetical protein
MIQLIIWLIQRLIRLLVLEHGIRRVLNKLLLLLLLSFTLPRGAKSLTAISSSMSPSFHQIVGGILKIVGWLNYLRYLLEMLLVQPTALSMSLNKRTFIRIHFLALNLNWSRLGRIEFFLLVCLVVNIVRILVIILLYILESLIILPVLNNNPIMVAVILKLLTIAKLF